MNNTSLLTASQRILLELARFLVHNEVSHKDFQVVSRWAFVQAGTEFLQKNGQFTLNGLLEVTGLSRNDVARAESQSSAEMVESHETWKDAMRVLHKWYTRSEFVDRDGIPRKLDLTDAHVFQELFGAETDDPKAVELMNELLDAACIEKVSRQSWKPTTRYYIPKNQDLRFHHFGQVVSRLISTLNRNMNSPDNDPWMERLVSSADLRNEARPLFARVGKEQALRFLESMDDWMSSNEHEDRQAFDEIGLGLYYFED